MLLDWKRQILNMEIWLKNEKEMLLDTEKKKILPTIAKNTVKYRNEKLQTPGVLSAPGRQLLIR